MPWTADFHLTPTAPHKKLQLLTPTTAAIQALIDLARARAIFPRLGAPTPEHFPILGASSPLSIERAAFSLFGIVGRGAHMTVYTRTSTSSLYSFWIAKRHPAKSTYPGLLDQAVAGGVAAGETPLSCIAREATEEAGLDAAIVRARAVAAGTVSWMNVADARAGGAEVGLVNPGVLYVYDLEVGADEFAPVAEEGDIEGFRLMGVDEVVAALRGGLFKPSCAMVMLDFLVRHGLVTAEDEEDYAEIVARLHRKLPFPLSPS